MRVEIGSKILVKRSDSSKKQSTSPTKNSLPKAKKTDPDTLRNPIITSHTSIALFQLKSSSTPKDRLVS
jgi:hypothetical protein